MLLCPDAAALMLLCPAQLQGREYTSLTGVTMDGARDSLLPNQIKQN
jgi:hypothetical protein